MRALNRKLLRDLVLLRSQILTLSILVVCGVAVLVSSWSAYQSLRRAMQSYYAENQLADVFLDLTRAPVSKAQEVRVLPGVELVETRVIVDALITVASQSEPAVGRLVSWDGALQQLNRLHVRSGRLPQKADLTEVLVHEAFASAHRIVPGDTLELFISGKRRKVRVSGVGLSPEYVYALSAVAPLPDDRHFGVFWMLKSELQSWGGYSDAFNHLVVKLSHSANLKEIQRRIDQSFASYGAMSSYDRSKQLSNRFVQDEIRQQRVISFLIPPIFMAVAVFILNVVSGRLITLQRAQIGTLKALGYSSERLTAHFFALISVILSFGVAPGIALGDWIGRWYARMYAEFFRFPSIEFSLDLSSIVFALFFGFIPGWIGSYAVLRRIFLMQPAEALRAQGQMRLEGGRRSVRLKSARMDLFSKMILRSLFSHPLRLLLNCIGIALSVAILINASFWGDVIEKMMDRQFFQMHREDLSVHLRSPRRSQVLHEVRSIPGVLMAEGERTVVVRLEHGHRSKDVAILGYERGSRMSRTLDDQDREVEVREGGVLLSRYFEKEYAIRVGERLVLNQIAGQQRRFEVLVLGFVDDLVGQQIYANKADLHRWLQEAPQMDTLYLRVDPKFAQSIYTDLKARPIVASVQIRKLQYQSFQRSVGEMILTFTWILYGFAIAIAGAVLYNSVRVSFSEVGWELASLQILGYPLGKTFELLWLQVGVEVLFALLPGLGLGYLLSLLSTHWIHNETLAFPLVIEGSTYAWAVLVVVAVFFAVSGYLWRQVERLDLSEALKARE